MAWSIVQQKIGSIIGGGLIITLDDVVAPGNKLIAFMLSGAQGSLTPAPDGWEVIDRLTFENDLGRQIHGVWKDVEPGDPGMVAWAGLGGSARPVGMLLEVYGLEAGAPSAIEVVENATGSSLALGAVDVPADALVIGAFGHDAGTGFANAAYTPGTGVTEMCDRPLFSSGNAGHLFVGRRTDLTADGAFVFSATAAVSNEWSGMVAVFDAGIDPPPPPLPSGGSVDTDEDGFTEADLLPLGHIGSWRVQRGQPAEITGSASIGSATIVLLNDPAHGNDRYNPLNESGELYGKLKPGVPVHLSVNADGALLGNDPRGLFGGRIRSITPKPLPGESIPSFVELVCEDALSRYGRTRASVEAAISRTHAGMREAILDAMGETRFALAHEAHSMPLSSWDGNGLSGLEALNGATLSRHFIRPEDAAGDWYEYTVRNRQWRLDGTVDWTVDAAAVHVLSDGWSLSGDSTINQQRASVTPVVFTPGNVRVWEAEVLPFVVKAAKPKVLWVDFDDYVHDPSVNVNRTGSGITANLEPFGDRAKLTLTSSGTTTVTGLSIEGRLARRLSNESVIVDESNGGEVRAGSDLSSQFIGSLAAAGGLAAHVVYRHGNAQYRPTLTITNWFPEMFEVELFDTIEVTIAQLSLDAMRFEIVGLTLEGHWAHAAGKAFHRAVLVLEQMPALPEDGWFVLDDSLLDGDAVLAY